MSVKDFSEKHSVALFYATLLLIVVIAIMSFSVFGSKGRGMNFNKQGMGQQQGMMQKSGDNSSDNRSMQGTSQDQSQQEQDADQMQGE